MFFHFKGGPVADLDKSCPSGSMFTGSTSDGPTGNPDRSSTKGTNSPTSFTNRDRKANFQTQSNKNPPNHFNSNPDSGSNNTPDRVELRVQK
jgi:hypothetical protein